MTWLNKRSPRKSIPPRERARTYNNSSPCVWNTLRISIVWKAGLHSGHRRHRRSAGDALPKACFIHFPPDFAGNYGPSAADNLAARCLRVNNPSVSTKLFAASPNPACKSVQKPGPSMSTAANAVQWMVIP